MGLTRQLQAERNPFSAAANHNKTLIDSLRTDLTKTKTQLTKSRTDHNATNALLQKIQADVVNEDPNSALSELLRIRKQLQDQVEKTMNKAAQAKAFLEKKKELEGSLAAAIRNNEELREDGLA
jgi:hypothetical protein